MSKRDFPEAPGLKILSEIGSGGMGSVFLARDGEGNRVAVKFMAALTGEAIDRFRRESTTMRSVTSRFVVKYIADSFDHDPPYLVYEYADGESLSELVDRDGPIRSRDLQTLAVGLADALHGLHMAGVVHRDLKPSNVIVTGDGPRVIDFGISALEGASSITGSVMPGTPDWMAPETRRGAVDALRQEKIDIYGFGLLIGFAATGLRPGPDALEYRDLGSLVGGRLGEMLDRCLLPDPALRPAAAELLWMSIGLNRDFGLEVLRGRSAIPQRTIDARRPRRPLRRALIALGACVVAMCTGAFGALVWSGYEFGKMSLGPTVTVLAAEPGSSVTTSSTTSTSVSTTSTTTRATSTTLGRASRSGPPATTVIRSREDSSSIAIFDVRTLPSERFGEPPVTEAIDALPSGSGTISTAALRTALESSGLTVQAASVVGSTTVAAFTSPDRTGCYMLALARSGSTLTSIRLAEKRTGGCTTREMTEWWTW